MFNVLPSHSGHNWDRGSTQNWRLLDILTALSTRKSAVTLGVQREWRKISLLKVVSDQITWHSISLYRSVVSRGLFFSLVILTVNSLVLDVHCYHARNTRTLMVSTGSISARHKAGLWWGCVGCRNQTEPGTAPASPCPPLPLPGRAESGGAAAAVEPAGQPVQSWTWTRAHLTPPAVTTQLSLPSCHGQLSAANALLETQSKLLLRCKSDWGFNNFMISSTW